MNKQLLKLMILIVVLSLMAGSVYAADPPAMEWHQAYNGSGEESHPHYVIETSDGGFLMVGETGFIPNSAKIYVVKTNSSGGLLWQKEFGSNGYNLGNGCVETPDGNYVIAGTLNYDAVLIKVNASTGNTLSGWPKTWNLGTEDSFEAVENTQDGGLIATGYRDGLAESTFINWGKGNLIKTDANGNQIWNKDISAYMHSGYRMKRISDGYMVSGHPAEEGQPDYTLMKFDFDGNVVWYKTPHPDIYWGFDVGANGHMILSGHGASPLSNNIDIITIEVDSGGNPLWTEYAGQPRGYNGDYIHDEVWGARATPDGGWILTAGSGDEYSYSECGHPLGCSDQWIVYCLKYSSSGTLEWEGLYGGEGDWAGEDICMTSDGGALIANDCGAFGFTKIEPFGAPDTTPPTPDPMTWSSVPNATGESTITMTATTASDPSGVEYNFDETSGNPGGTDSGWQDSTSYTDTGLNSGTQYCYRVQARDKSVNQNATAYSSTQCATTTAPDTTPPTPDPMTWQTVPYATGSSAIAMTATTATDPSGVQYYFDEITGNPGATDSGWQSSTNYTDSGLNASTQYTYTVTARDVSVNFNETAASTDESATTSAPPVFKLDFGTVSGVGSSWTNVTLSETYTSPVVVAVANYDNTSDPAVVRIRNASGSSFDVRVDAAGGAAPSGLDVHYMVVEEGVYTVANDGVKMEAVKYNSTVTDENNSWVGQPQTYSNSYTSPVVLGQVMTYADPDFSTFWCFGSARANPPDTSNLNTGKSVAEDTDTTRENETVGYIVIEAGSGTMAGTDYVAALGADGVAGVTNSPPYTYSISGLSEASVGIASLSAMDGGNGGWALLYGANPVTASAINIAIDEDIVGDTERSHTGEQVAYIVFESAAPPDTTPPTPDPMTWASVPSADSDTAISMTATTATDPSGVEYNFDETSGNPGGSDSGWQDSTSYTDSGLTASTQYCYEVQARDKSVNQNATAVSTNECATTQAAPDTTPPTPDPMTWASVPSSGSDSEVSMTATTATDPSGVEYYFMETTANPGGSDSGWQDSTSYTDTGLTGSTQYCYEVQARDKSANQNATAWSTNECATTQATPDTTPPTPDPMTWASVPAAGGTDNISMTATTATDPSGVEYNFDETSGNPGGTDSGWQDSTSYNDTGLSASTQYCYRVQARDKSVNQNATAWSTTECATTDAIPDTDPPTPDPMTWSSVPAAASSSQIDMTATTATDPSGVEYFFDETTSGPGATDSGWQSGAGYSDTGLDPDTQYTYRARARDMSVNQNATAWSTSESATTQAGGWTQIIYDDFEGGFGNWNDGGLDCKLYTGGTYAHQGSNALDLEDNTSTSVATTDNLALAGYAEVKVDFWYYPRSMDNSNEDFWLQISTNGGANFDTVEEWNEGDEFENDNFYPDSVTITGYTLTDQTQLRFRCDASGGADDVYIDEVLVSAQGGGAPDTDPPTPNPATWSSVPSADSSSAISMTATTGSDPSGVEYSFDETSGNPGGSDSGWQSSASYTDSGLTESTQYCYRVRMRDQSPNQNTGSWSTTECATTQAGGGSWIKVDDRDGSVTYAGSTWHQTSPSTAYMNTATYTQDMGITATYSFTGTQVRFYVWQYDTSQGYDVYIDEQFQQTVNISAGSEASIQAWESGTLADTTHALKLVTASGEPHVDAFEHFGN